MPGPLSLPESCGFCCVWIRRMCGLVCVLCGGELLPIRVALWAWFGWWLVST